VEMQNSAQIQRPPRRLFYLSLYLCIAAVYLLTASGRIGLSDSVAMFNVAESVINQRSFSSEPCQADAHDLSMGASVGCVPGTDGRHYAAYGLLPSLSVIPAIYCARIASHVLHVNPVVTSKAAVSLFTLLIASLVPVAVAAWILKLQYSLRTAVLSAGILAFASSYWHFSVRGFFSEPYFTLPLVIAACLLSDPRRRFACALAGLAFGLACAARFNGVILFPAFILFMALYIRAHWQPFARFLRDATYFCSTLSVCVLLILWANYARFGSPLKTGYHLAFPSASVLLSTPLLRGLPQVLFSGEIGLLVFAPWVLMSFFRFPRFAREHLPEAVLCATCFLIYLLFFAKFYDPHGGWVAGPRYLLPTLPFLAVAASPALESLQQAVAWKRRPWVMAVVVSLVCAGFLIQCVGSMFPDERYYALMIFYDHRPVKPWWSGSIPFASIDFLFRMKTAEKESSRPTEVDQLAERREIEAALNSADSAPTEDDYLGRFPNPSNMMSPNLMLVKLKLMGLPASVGLIYLLVVFAIGLPGAVGLKRCLAT